MEGEEDAWKLDEMKVEVRWRKRIIRVNELKRKCLEVRWME